MSNFSFYFYFAHHLVCLIFVAIEFYWKSTKLQAQFRSRDKNARHKIGKVQPHAHRPRNLYGTSARDYDVIFIEPGWVIFRRFNWLLLMTSFFLADEKSRK